MYRRFGLTECRWCKHQTSKSDIIAIRIWWYKLKYDNKEDTLFKNLNHCSILPYYQLPVYKLSLSLSLFISDQFADWKFEIIVLQACNDMQWLLPILQECMQVLVMQAVDVYRMARLFMNIRLRSHSCMMTTDVTWQSQLLHTLKAIGRVWWFSVMLLTFLVNYVAIPDYDTDTGMFLCDIPMGVIAGYNNNLIMITIIKKQQ